MPGRMFEWAARSAVRDAREKALSGRHDKAVHNLERLRLMRQRSQGAEHGDTLRVATELGAMLAAAGRPGEAVAVLADVVSRLRMRRRRRAARRRGCRVTALLSARRHLHLGGRTAGGPDRGDPAPAARRRAPRTTDLDRASPGRRPSRHRRPVAGAGGPAGRGRAQRAAASAAVSGIEKAALAAFRRMKDYVRDPRPPLAAGDGGAVSFLPWSVEHGADALWRGGTSWRGMERTPRSTRRPRRRSASPTRTSWAFRDAARKRLPSTRRCSGCGGSPCRNAIPTP
ncbi:tetratricopeptide repeat protein [Amycolatopsis acidiphila]|uniref:Tetratricopeptide repeat protein n=1 Tax=Amycolatopsis acidiphila TaxID=715473 RepID=A0A558AFC1_9PSEU|nr:tetratricopeptide repeat protein [Amycolatopsis acidiphila]